MKAIIGRSSAKVERVKGTSDQIGCVSLSLIDGGGVATPDWCSSRFMLHCDPEVN